MSQALGNPPSNFAVGPMTHTLPAGTRLLRIYFSGGPHPAQWNQFRDFGPTNSRFDHHRPPQQVQTRSILYATVGKDAFATALAEVFQDTRLIDRHRRAPRLAVFALTRPLALLDTGSNWPLQAGGNMSINSGPRSQSRKWSRAIYQQYFGVEGIYYPSSLLNTPCVAVYDRGKPALAANFLVDRALDNPQLLKAITKEASYLNFGVV